MKILFLIASLIGFLQMNAQSQNGNSWIVEHNKVIRLKATGENEAKNNMKLNAADLTKEGQLYINYKEEKPQKDWKRTFAVFDTRDSELIKYSGSSFKIGNGKLRDLHSQGIKTIKIYTWALPTDPELAARIRIRREHLCTIKLE